MELQHSKSCLAPFIIRPKFTKDKRPNLNNETEVIPCGKCFKCLRRKANGWAFRLEQEQKHSHNTIWINLTYSDKFLPLTKSGYSTLSKRHFQLFMKKLRKAHEPLQDHSIKYFVAGEYGADRDRPHMHVLLFNARIELVQDAWPHGNVWYGTAETRSINYTLKYMMKEDLLPLFKGDDRVPEFRLMSKGLGAKYVSEQIIAWHQADPVNRMYCNVPGGKKIAMPRYYKDRIYKAIQIPVMELTGKVNRKKKVNGKIIYKKVQQQRKQIATINAKEYEEKAIEWMNKATYLEVHNLTESQKYLTSKMHKNAKRTTKADGSRQTNYSALTKFKT